MELPSTSPSGRNPASRTSRNSLTDRSEVKIAPGFPGCSSARRRMASWGTPAASSCAWAFWSFIVLLARLAKGLPAWRLAAPCHRSPLPLTSEPHPGHLPALRVEREDGEAAGPGRGLGGGEPRDGGADDRDLGDVVPAVLDRGAVPVAHPQVKGRDDDPVRAHAADI